MPSFRRGTVTGILAERQGLQRVTVGDERAYVLTALTGPVAVGDDVVMNTTAVDLGLGTGGWHVVHWNMARDRWAEPGPGHIMKVRYTSLQADTGAAEEDHPDLPHDLGGMPVVACSLHSQMAVVATTLRSLRPDAVIAYVMTDGAALPLALSDLVADLCERGLLDITLTAGHAFGGDLEAVTVPSALALARHVRAADVAIVAMGPGVVGTGTALGTTALEVAGILDAASWLGGHAICCVRASDVDARERHQGISHHTRTALDAVRSPVTVPVPPALWPLVPADDRHTWRRVEVPDTMGLLADHRLRVTTMGRGPDQEPTFFAAAAAAGVVAAELGSDP